MKFSELLGEPEPPEPEHDRERELPEAAEPISVFAPVPVAAPPAPTSVAYPSAPPEPVAPRQSFSPVPPLDSPPPFDSALTPPPAPPAPAPAPYAAPPADLGAAPRSGLAEINVRQEVAPPPPVDEPHAVDGLANLQAVVDDLLPSTTRRGKK